MPAVRKRNRVIKLKPYGKRMNKSELIDAVAGVADLSKADSARAVDGVIEALTEAVD